MTWHFAAITIRSCSRLILQTAFVPVGLPFSMPGLAACGGEETLRGPLLYHPAEDDL
jgi:hypothetical protein